MSVDKRPLDEGHSETVAKKAKPITEFFVKSKVKSIAKEKKVTAISSTSHIPTTKLKFDTSLEPQDFKEHFVRSLNSEQKELLSLEIDTLEDSWFKALHEELLKPYFLTLKRFLKTQNEIFPPLQDIYSWSRLTPLQSVKVIVLGQDPYHNVNQAHGLAFSVKHPTPPPPSLKNIYKALKIDYEKFEIPSKKGDLTQWAEQGVLLLNACLTVKPHQANSHSKKGWETFTEKVLKVALTGTTNNKVILLWGTPAQKRFENLKLSKADNLLVLKSVHPSPLSARRGFFEAHHFKKCNDWLIEQKENPIKWDLV